MKFYYLPHPMGFISFSKKHFIIYNETQTATYTKLRTQSEFNQEVRHFQSKRMSDNIKKYQYNKNTPLQEVGFDSVSWTIK